MTKQCIFFKWKKNWKKWLVIVNKAYEVLSWTEKNVVVEKKNSNEKGNAKYNKTKN